MQLRYKILPFLLASASLCEARCRNIILHLEDQDAKALGTQGRTVDVAMLCHERNYFFPAATTMQIFEWQNGKFCQAWKSCGNIAKWEIAAGASISISWGDIWDDVTSHTKVHTFADLSQYIEERGRIDSDREDTQVNVRLGFQFGKIERYCEDLAPKICW